MFLCEIMPLNVNNQPTCGKEDDITSMLKCIWYCYEANSFTRHLKSLLSEMGLHSAQLRFLCSLEYLKS